MLSGGLNLTLGGSRGRSPLASPDVAGVRFSGTEWERLQQLSKSAEMSMSEFVRNHLGKVSVRNRNDERKQVAMLNRINANLNMIKYWKKFEYQATREKDTATFR
ncbi:plasmid mobilization protein [Candidatus Fukatsuia symbiotica]|uniref:plasmid mobilization protein n=1 Tax=Candidatus Fukatsuia TaxID=1927833 RepID=UPI000E76E4D4